VTPELAMSATDLPVDAGDRDWTVERLYERYSTPVYRHCLRELGSREDAEEVLQDTFLNAFRSLRRGFTPQMPLAWLLTIARNLCRSRTRSDGARVRTEPLERIGDVAVSQDSWNEELQAIARALGELPETQRRAFLLREWHGLSYDEIADELGVSHSAVATHIFRGRRAMSGALRRALVRPARDRLASLATLDPLLAWIRESMAAATAATVATGIVVATVVSAAPSARPQASEATTRVPAAPVVQRSNRTRSLAAVLVSAADTEVGARPSRRPESRPMPRRAAPSAIAAPHRGVGVPRDRALRSRHASPGSPPAADEGAPAAGGRPAERTPVVPTEGPPVPPVPRAAPAASADAEPAAAEQDETQAAGRPRTKGQADHPAPPAAPGRGQGRHNGVGHGRPEAVRFADGNPVLGEGRHDGAAPAGDADAPGVGKGRDEAPGQSDQPVDQGNDPPRATGPEPAAGHGQGSDQDHGAGPEQAGGQGQDNGQDQDKSAEESSSPEHGGAQDPPPQSEKPMPPR
jgi:RNA polymerase sigma-70 factor (ECF subfamily)